MLDKVNTDKMYFTKCNYYIVLPEILTSYLQIGEELETMGNTNVLHLINKKKLKNFLLKYLKKNVVMIGKQDVNL